MKIQKILGSFILFALLSPLLASAHEELSQQEIEWREQAIREAVQDARKWHTILEDAQPKQVYQGRMDRGRVAWAHSDESTLQKNLQFQKFSNKERQSFFSTRDMALAGLSAGGILYFFPEQKIFFWEINDNSRNNNGSESIDDILMNPLIGGILRGVLSNLQKDLKNNDGKLMGSRRAGSFAMIILNPAEALAQNVNHFAGGKVFEDGSTEITTIAPMRPEYMPDPLKTPPNYIGLHFQLRF